MMFTIIYDLKFKREDTYTNEVYTFHCEADNAYEAAKKCMDFENNEFTECRVLAVNLVNVEEYKEAMNDHEVWKEYDMKEKRFRNNVAEACGAWERFKKEA